MKKEKHYIVICLGIGALFLSSCGVKPAHVDPPMGAEHTTFPNTYPSAETIPQPGLENKEL